MKCFCFAIALFMASSVHAQKREQISLNNQWIVKSMNENDPLSEKLPSDFRNPGKSWFTGNMPKQVQEFVFEKGELPDPHIGDNAALWLPVFKKGWLYCKRFSTPVNLGHISLCFLGLDTEVDIILNGKKIAYCNNMFRRWTIPVEKELYAVGKENTLMLWFHSPEAVIDQIMSKNEVSGIQPKKLIRKSGSDFSAYLGSRPSFIKTGIFDQVFLDIVPEIYLGDVCVRSKLSPDYSNAVIVVHPDIAHSDKSKIGYELLSPTGALLSAKILEVKDSFTIQLNHPKLWWPMDYGDQPLYRLKVKLFDNKELVDLKEIKFGIREIKMELKDQKTEEARFGYRVNGKMIFMHGACWAPLEGFTHVWDAKRADKLLELMKLGHLNFLRIWGEGEIPGTSLFEKCDQDGIVVWMEFMTSAPLQHPINSPAFRANISAEIEDEIKRFRNHPCIAMWCGGNEHYLKFKSNDGDNSQPIGRELFQKIMPELVGKFDPQRYFHPSSPWGGENWSDGNYPLEGDFHDYSNFRFQPQATAPLFTTEACMVSPYSLHNMKRFMSREEIWPEGFRFSVDSPGKKAWPKGWETHSVGSAWEKIGRIQDYCDIQNAEDACRVFCTVHGEYLRDRYERQRRGVPDGQPDGNRRSWGVNIWRLNDTWPMIYMSVVDYYLEPKIPYYFLKRACEPVLVSFEQTPERICAWVINDSPETIKDSMIVELRAFNGTLKNRVARKVNLQPGESKRIVDLTLFGEIVKRDVYLTGSIGGKTVSQLLQAEKFLNLLPSTIVAESIPEGIVLLADRFVKDVALSIPDTTGAVFEDNYFNLLPGVKKTIRIIDSQNGKILDIKGVNSEKIQIRL